MDADDAGVPYGAYARFWVEPERRAEFETASDARRAAWVWRSYVGAARRATGDASRSATRQMTADPDASAAVLAPHLVVPVEPLAGALGRAHAASVGRYRTT